MPINLPRFSNPLIVASLAFLLGACQQLGGEKPGIEVERNAWETHQPGCLGESCPLVNIDTLVFADEPSLNRLIEQRLLSMTAQTPDAPPPSSLKAYESQFLANAKPGWMSYLQAKLRDQHDQLLVIEFSSYLATGGAHGVLGRGFINYDRTQKRALAPEELIVPGEERAFWSLVERARYRWLAANQLDKDPGFVAQWPLRQTPNIALTRGSVLLKYDVGSIAPYAMGHPELEIPYAQLKGILRPKYFPGQT